MALVVVKQGRLNQDSSFFNDCHNSTRNKIVTLSRNPPVLLLVEGGAPSSSVLRSNSSSFSSSSANIMKLPFSSMAQQEQHRKHSHNTRHGGQIQHSISISTAWWSHISTVSMLIEIYPLTLNSPIQIAPFKVTVVLWTAAKHDLNLICALLKHSSNNRYRLIHFQPNRSSGWVIW